MRIYELYKLINQNFKKSNNSNILYDEWKNLTIEEKEKIKESMGIPDFCSIFPDKEKKGVWSIINTKYFHKDEIGYIVKIDNTDVYVYYNYKQASKDREIIQKTTYYLSFRCRSIN